MSKEVFEQRLMKAYFRKFGKNADCPSQTVDYLNHDGTNYAVLSNVNGTLAVYKLYKDEFPNGKFRYCNYLPRHLALDLGFEIRN
jgi:hypothetical protein